MCKLSPNREQLTLKGKGKPHAGAFIYLSDFGGRSDTGGWTNNLARRFVSDFAWCFWCPKQMESLLPPLSSSNL